MINCYGYQGCIKAGIYFRVAVLWSRDLSDNEVTKEKQVGTKNDRTDKISR